MRNRIREWGLAVGVLLWVIAAALTLSGIVGMETTLEANHDLPPSTQTVQRAASASPKAAATPAAATSAS